MHILCRSAMFASSAIVLVSGPAIAQEKAFDIPAQSAQTAIGAMGRQAGIQIIAARSATNGKRTNAVRGNMPVEEALSRLLLGTGLTARQSGPQTYTVVLGGENGAAAMEKMPQVASAEGSADAGTFEAPQEIIVTASRIQRSGFDAPTPTTVLGALEMSQGNRSNIGEVLNDLPQFRASTTAVSTVGSTNTGTTTADLRGLGANRTLTLLNGHRFMGASDLNIVPQELIKRVDVVTGGASAAWGSGAVAGVVNIILDEDLTGIRAGAQTGVSSRGDAARYGINLAAGTRFADGRGHLMIAGGYLDNKGALSRSDRPFLDSGLVSIGDNQFRLANDVNSVQLYNGGTVLSPFTGATLGVFNPDGTLSPFPYGGETFGDSTIGGGGQGLYDYVAVSAPFKRANMFARISYELNDTLKVWAEGSFSRNWAHYGFFTEPAVALIAPDNAFLSPATLDQITAAGLPAGAPFLVGRFLDDVGGPNRFLDFRVKRRNLEGAIGLEGRFANWTYKAYYDHGELRDNGALANQSISARFANAVDSVLVGGSPVCRINADVDTTNDAAGCVPINLLGNGNITPQAAAYSFGTYRSIQTSKLDALGASLHGQPFTTWADEVDLAVGLDFRWEEFRTNAIDPISAANGFSLVNASELNGVFDVKEVFGEVNIPLLDAVDVARLEVNGAARYSDYSTSGGIWTWKTGGTLRLFNDFLLRGVYSRDIRSPSIAEYFSQRRVNIGVPVVDPYTEMADTATLFTGGNPDLRPEISHTFTVGASYSPVRVPGLRLSIDYYDIDIRNVIASLTAQDTLDQCFEALPADNSCGGVITRSETDTTITGTFRNLANYGTRGLDIEASYVLPLDRISSGGSGNLRFRAFATHVIALEIDDGVRVTDRAGIVGNTTEFSIPKWRISASFGYENRSFGGDVRVRHVSGGRFQDAPIVNNHLDSQTYIDLDLRYNVGPFTLFGSVTNLFDVNPKYVTNVAAINYDVIGTYMSGGVKVKF